MVGGFGRVLLVIVSDIVLGSKFNETLPFEVKGLCCVSGFW